MTAVVSLSVLVCGHWWLMFADVNVIRRGYGEGSSSVVLFVLSFCAERSYLLHECSVLSPGVTWPPKPQKPIDKTFPLTAALLQYLVHFHAAYIDVILSEWADVERSHTNMYSAQQGCFCFVLFFMKIQLNCAIILNCCLCKYLEKYNLFLWTKLYFQHHMIFRYHSNILICCSRNISDYYQCWKQSCCTIFLWKPRYIFF